MRFSTFLRTLARPGQAFHDPLGVRGRRYVTWIVGAMAVLFFFILWKPWIHGNDGARNYAYVRSFWIDGDLDFTNEFEHFRAAGDYQIKRPPDPVTGLPGNALGIGCSILWTPFFLIAHLVAFLAPGVEPDGYGAVYAWAISFATALYAAAGLLLLTRVLCWRFCPLDALVSVSAVWMGSPLIFYMYLHPSMSHGCSFFLCSLIVYQYERWQDLQKAHHFFLLGLSCGLALATRFNNGVYLAILVVFCGRAWFLLPGAHHEYRKSRWLFGATLLALLGVSIGFLPQMAAWRYFHGSWFSGPRNYDLGASLEIWKSTHILDVLLSGWRGLFVWSPTLFFAVVGFSMLLGRRRLLDTTLAIMFLVQLWVIGGWNMWWGGASFGQRFFINFTPAFAIGLGWLFSSLRFGRPRKALVAMLAASVLWTGGLAVQYIGGVIPREGAVSISQLASNQINEVPKTIFAHLKFLRPGARGSDANPPPLDTPEP